MHDNKLVKFLAKLSKSELRAFSKYLSNIYSNTHVLFRLLEQIRKQYPSFEPKKMEAEQIFLKVYPGKPFNNKLLLTEVSKLRNELKRFLIWKYQDDFEYESDYILLQLYKRYGLNEHVEKKLIDMKRINEEQPEKDLWHWQRKMQLEHEHYYYISNRRISNKAVQIHKAMNDLDSFYALAKLQYSAEYFNRKNLLQEKISELPLNENIHKIEWDSSFLLHHSYQLALSMIKDRDEASFQSLKTIMTEQIECFHESDRLIFISYLVNHMADGLKKGNLDLIAPAFEWYQQGIKYEVFLKDGYFEYTHFENIFNIASALKAYNWLEDFLKKWGDFLEPNIRENTLSISRAFVSFNKKEFEMTLKLLKNLSISPINDIAQKVKYNLLLIAANFEINPEGELIRSKYEAFEKNVKNDSLMSETMKKGVLNFIKIIRKLTSRKVDKSKIERLMKDFEVLYFRVWLNEKIEAL